MGSQSPISDKDDQAAKELHCSFCLKPLNNHCVGARCGWFVCSDRDCAAVFDIRSGRILAPLQVRNQRG
jgi:hypothetical protein